ncbi:MAG: 3-oxoadipyl-CoA thiolase [Acidiferrobacterales bacterium]|nr:3-oxoadipyl-CoA thiolase [Acidiferrobacterales bacterium]
MPESFICDYIRTPIGRFGGTLCDIRTDDLAAIPIQALLERNDRLDPARIDEVILGCANQAGEDNRNVARMALLLAGIPHSVPGTTINRLCGSGMDALIMASRSIRCGDLDLVIAGGVESMSRAPFVMPKATRPFSRKAEIYDTTLGWRFVNPLIRQQYGVDSMAQTAQIVAEEYGISRDDQDQFALRSQTRANSATARLATEITPVEVPQPHTEPIAVSKDEHPRETTLESLRALPPLFRDNGCVTAGNASGVNDGAAALLVASEDAVRQFDLKPIARIAGGASAGVAPRIMGVGPVPATRRLCNQLNLTPKSFSVIELNEAFASQALAVLRELRVDDDAGHVNPNGGAIALGHPLGMSGARIAGSAALELKNAGDFALATMCVGVGQGIAIALEKV